MAERRCRECGCTDERACIRIFPWSDLGDETCRWVAPDLCSACLPGAGDAWTPPPPAPETELERELEQVARAGDPALVPILPKARS